MSLNISNDRNNVTLVTEHAHGSPPHSSHSSSEHGTAPLNGNGEDHPEPEAQEKPTPIPQQVSESAAERSTRAISDPGGTRLDSTLRQFLWTWILTLIATGWVTFTICFAYNCTLQSPFSTALLFSRPENTLLVLNVLSHGTIILLKDLTSCAFEAVRWAFASSREGVSASNFIGLSRATNALGVLGLVFSTSGSYGLGKDGYRLWAFQRIFFVLLHAVIGIALLTNVSFMSSWRPAYLLSFDNGAGIGPINATLANATQALTFWSWFNGLVVSPNYITTIPLSNPSECASGLCASYFLPGDIYNLTPPVPSIEEYPEATTIVLTNLTGYQLEFYPLDNATELNDATCEVYGVDSASADDSVAILICLKKSGNSLLAAMNACSQTPYCLSYNGWENDIIYTNVTISKRQATLVFSRADNTTLDVPSISPPEPVDYNVTDFFPIYNFAMNFTATPVILSYIKSVASQVNLAGNDVYPVQQLLRQFIAVPVGLYNEPTLLGTYPAENQNVTGYLGIPAYQIVISSASLYAFIAGAIASLVWSIGLLVTCAHVQSPNSSSYPEIDFASKCVEFRVQEGEVPVSMTELLHPLSNSNSGSIRARVSRHRFYVGAQDGHVALNLNERTGALVKGTKYT